MSAGGILDALVALGGFTGLGSLAASAATLVKASRLAEETRAVARNTRQLAPDHGESVADKQGQLLELVRSQGHQLGEHHDLMIRILDQIGDLSTRVTRIEGRG